MHDYIRHGENVYLYNVGDVDTASSLLLDLMNRLYAAIAASFVRSKNGIKAQVSEYREYSGSCFKTNRIAI